MSLGSLEVPDVWHRPAIDQTGDTALHMPVCFRWVYYFLTNKQENNFKELFTLCYLFSQLTVTKSFTMGQTPKYLDDQKKFIKIMEITPEESLMCSYLAASCVFIDTYRVS